MLQLIRNILIVEKNFSSLTGKLKQKCVKDNMTNRKKEYPWEKSYPDGLNWDAKINPQPLYSILEESAANYPENICIDYYGKKYTYAEVNNLVNRMAMGLQENGVEKGTRVG